jgi:hypothetical protein
VLICHQESRQEIGQSESFYSDHPTKKRWFSGTSLVLEPLNDLNDRLSGVLLDRRDISRVRFQKQAIETLIADDNRCGGNSKNFPHSPF